MYKHLEKLNVKPNLPDNKVSQYTAKKFRSASEICKYDCSFEESLLKEFQTKPENSLNGYLNDRRSRNEDIMKSLSELQDVVERVEPVETRNRESSTKSRADSITMLRMKAETAAEIYLGLDDAGKLLRFLDFYVELFQHHSTDDSVAFSDEKIVKSFNLFDGDVKKSAEFLAVAEELEELGFEADKVVSALMLFSNDREAALQFLMKD